MTDYLMENEQNNIFAGENDQLWIPGNPRGNSKFGCILLHGAATPSQFADVARYGSAELPAYLATAGIPCVAGFMGGDTFGNATGVARVQPALTYLSGAAGGASAVKAHLIGFSMGFAIALNYAAANPGKVASIIGILPLTNIDTIYQGNVGGLRATIQTAWGVVHPAALPAGANLLTAAAAVKAAGIPCKMYYSPVDALASPADAVVMGAALGINPISYDPNSTGHTEATFKKIGDYGKGNWRDIIDFVKAYGA